MKDTEQRWWQELLDNRTKAYVPQDWHQKLKIWEPLKDANLRFLSKELQKKDYAYLLRGHLFYFAIDYACNRYSIPDVLVERYYLPELKSNHREADTLIIFHLKKGTEDQPVLKVTVGSDVADAFVVLLFNVFSSNIQADVWMLLNHTTTVGDIS